MVEGWIKVYTADEEYQAELVKSLLTNNGLNPVILDQKGDGFRLGTAEVYVAPEESGRAMDIINKNKN